MQRRLGLCQLQLLPLLVGRRRDSAAEFAEVLLHLRDAEAQILAQVVRVRGEVVDVQCERAEMRVEEIAVPLGQLPASRMSVRLFKQ